VTGVLCPGFGAFSGPYALNNQRTGGLVIITLLSSIWWTPFLEARVPGYRSRGPGFDSRLYRIFWQAVGLKRGPLSLVRITEELYEWRKWQLRSRKSRLTAMGIRCIDHAIPLYRQILSVTSPTWGGHSVGIVRVWTKNHGALFYWILSTLPILAKIGQMCWTLYNKNTNAWMYLQFVNWREKIFYAKAATGT
jgi:hypothetical protein